MRLPHRLRLAPDLIIGELLVVLHASRHTLNLLCLLVQLEVAPRILLIRHTAEEDFLFVAPPEHVIERVLSHLFRVHALVAALSEDDVAFAALLVHVLHLLILTLLILITPQPLLLHHCLTQQPILQVLRRLLLLREIL